MDPRDMTDGEQHELTDLRTRLAAGSPGELRALELLVDLAEWENGPGVECAEAPSAREMIDVAMIGQLGQGEHPAATDVGTAWRFEGWAQHGQDATAYLGDMATVGQLAGVLADVRDDRPVMVITENGAGWLSVVRDEHSGAVDLIARGVEL